MNPRTGVPCTIGGDASGIVVESSLYVKGGCYLHALSDAAAAHLNRHDAITLATAILRYVGPVCLDHPTYVGKRKPRATCKNPNGCERCWQVWRRAQQQQSAGLRREDRAL